MNDSIVITRIDLEALTRLAGFGGAYSLAQELDRAEVVEPDAVPGDVVTMNSRVRLEDMDTGGVSEYTLVYPHQPRTASSVSVLAPIGTAMLGYRVGDVIEWRVPKGIRRLKVLEVLYQPEAAGEVRPDFR